MNRFRPLSFLALGILILATSACTNSPDPVGQEMAVVAMRLPETVSFNYHIKPILSDRCYACHGPDESKQEAGIFLHTPEGLFKKTSNGNPLVIPHDPAASLLVQRIEHTNPDSIMPPSASNLELEAHEVALIKKWIEQGAKWEKHWAFIPSTRPQVPASPHPGKDLNPIDHFVFRKLEEKGLSPSPITTSGALLRRLSLDVRGLPPSLQEVQSFTATGDFQAYTQKVDAYLASMDHAETMTAFWLDLARYADSNGYQDDLERSMWPWRDWVTKAFYENLPYDLFVTYQLAGDLIPDASPESILATGFNRNHPITQEGGALDEEYRNEYVANRTSTSFTVFQAMTMECARCHDHKFDPISQKEFYQVSDFFNHVPEKGVADYGELVVPHMKVDRHTVDQILDFVTVPDSQLPAYPLVMQEEPGIRKTHLLSRGQYDQPLEVVDCGTPNAILDFENKFPKNRLGFAQWLFDPQNPLTARVMVNRIWQRYFGVGIVSTPGDFGNQGALPTHPELLDWLAMELVEHEWDLRHIERLILLSYTYRQQSLQQPGDPDPENTWLARAPRSRLSAEQIRDQALAISGLLINQPGGPPVKPYQPAGLWKEKTAGGGYTEYTQDHGQALYRKSLYTFWKRTIPPPSLLTFDAPSRDVCTVSRQKTNTPLQALVLLNDPQQMEAAIVLAQKVLEDEPDQLLRRAFELVTLRSPDPEELAILESYYEEEKSRLQGSSESLRELLGTGEYPLQSPPQDSVSLGALAMVNSMLFNLDETITKP